MSFTYLALFTGDYLKDTRHLSPERHGIYLLLLIHCWDTRDPVPLDEQEQAAITNCRSANEIESLRYVLRRYFVKMADGWYNARMQKEIIKVQALSRAWSEAGKKGAAAKAKGRSSLGSAKAQPRPLSSSSSSSSSLSSSTANTETLAPTPPGIDAASPPVVAIPLNNKTEFPVTQAMVDEWVKLYPDCDVLQTLREIRGWNLANPTKNKTKTGILNHINRWLAKEQNHG